MFTRNSFMFFSSQEFNLSRKLRGEGAWEAQTREFMFFLLFIFLTLSD